MRALLCIGFLVSLALTGNAHAQALGPITPAGCLHLTHFDTVQVTGRLSQTTFPGPPNFESVAKGDAAEPTYLLEFPHPICVDDDNEFADPTKTFDLVHVSTMQAALWPMLREALGRTVTITGEGYAAFTAEHRAPLVVMAITIKVGKPER